MAVFRPYRAAATATLVALPAEELLEGPHVLQADTVVERVDVDAGPPDRDEVVRSRLGRGAHTEGISSRRTTRPS